MTPFLKQRLALGQATVQGEENWLDWVLSLMSLPDLLGRLMTDLQQTRDPDGQATTASGERSAVGSNPVAVTF